MQTGIIGRIVRKRRFGFIFPDDNTEDVFFSSDVIGQAVFDKLSECQKVEFEMELDIKQPNRTRAINVKPI